MVCQCAHLLPCAAVIEEANWLTLEKDLEKPGDGFDAVICLGNSFAHLPDFKGGGRAGVGVSEKGREVPMYMCTASPSRLRTCPNLCHKWGSVLCMAELQYPGVSPGRLRPCPSSRPVWAQWVLGGRAMCFYVTSLAGLQKHLDLCHKWSAGFFTWHALPQAG